MAITLTTSVGSLNLNAGAYSLVGIDLGKNNRTEIVIEPPGATTPVLAKVWNQRCTMTITLQVKAATAVALVNAVEAVRNEFNGQANTLTYSLGGTAKVITTYDSQIDPVDTNTSGDFSTLYVAVSQFIIPRWTFQVTRDALFTSGSTRPMVV